MGSLWAEVQDKRAFLQEMSRSMGDRSLSTETIIDYLVLILGVLLGLIVAYLLWNSRGFWRGRIVYLKKKLKNQTTAAPRYKASVEIAVDAWGPQNIVHTTTANLSDGGMFIKLNPPLKVGDIFRFRLRLSQMERILGSAEVMWVQNKWSEHHPTGIGCKFHNMSSEDQNRIRLWIRQQKLRRLV